MTDSITAGLIGFAGALLGALIVYWTSLSIARWSRTMDLHREFNAERMNAARSGAFKFMKKHWNKTLLDISDEDRLDMASVPLWEVVYFYQRLWALIENNQIIASVAPKLFGEVFLWWYVVVFEKRLFGAEWQSAQDIKRLYIWMNKHARRSDWNDWVKRYDLEQTNLNKRYSRDKQVKPDPKSSTPAPSSESESQ